MTLPRLILTLPGSLFLAIPAVAQPAPASTATTTAPATEKPVCRYEAVTGSQFEKRTCHTKAEWAQIDEANSQDAQRLLRSPGRQSGN